MSMSRCIFLLRSDCGWGDNESLPMTVSDTEPDSLAVVGLKGEEYIVIFA